MAAEAPNRQYVESPAMVRRHNSILLANIAAEQWPDCFADWAPKVFLSLWYRIIFGGNMKSLFRFTAFASALVLLACSGGGSSTSGTTTLPITVATGAPVEGASVTVVDSRGSAETCASTTNSSGVVNCALSNTMTAPYLIQANKLTTTMYAVLPDTAARVNVTPISTAMAKKFASDNGIEPEQIVSQPSLMASTNKASAQAAVDLVNAIIKVIALQTANISIDNALTQQYAATTSDNLDKIIHNMNIVTDSSGIAITIPTSGGTVNVNVAFSANKTDAVNSVTTNTASVRADFSDQDLIEASIDKFFSNFAKCADSTAKATLVSMIEARAYTAGQTTIKFMGGVKVEDWVDGMCALEVGKLTRTYTKSVARYGNKILLLMGVKQPTGGEFELPLAMIKKNNEWKLLSDNLPVNQSIRTRHSLEFIIDHDNGTEKFQYRRYLDTWVEKKSVDNIIPDKIELYAIPLRDVTDKFTVSNFANTKIFTIYKSDSQKCPNVLFVPRASRGSDNNCDAFSYDSDFPTVFSDLEKSDLTHIVFKALDANDNCLNCDNAGLPESGAIVGKAIPFSTVFGSSVTKSDLTAGIDRSKLPSSASLAYRTYFAAPSESDLTNISSSFKSVSLGSTIRVPWVRAANKSQVSGNWGGYNLCGGSVWAEIPDRPTIAGVADYWDVTFPVSGKTFNNAGFISISIANNVKQSEFVFYIQGQRRTKCSV
jgi:hypothetical protein